MYNIPNSRYLLKSLPLDGNWIKAHWMRAGSGPHTTFAGEQVIDELAHAAKMDPVAFRIQNVVQGNDWHAGQVEDQLLAVLNAVTKAAELAAEGHRPRTCRTPTSSPAAASPGRTSTARRPTPRRRRSPTSR